MGFADWFIMKSKEQEEADSRRYKQWAFPYGDAQKETVSALLKQLLPKEKTDMAMLNFLMGKEAYYGTTDPNPEKSDDSNRQKRLDRAYRALKGPMPRSKYSQIYRYLALIAADEQVDETLNYPSVEELIRQAEAWEA